MSQIHLDDVAGLHRGQSVELFQHVKPFACGDGKGESLLHCVQEIQAVGSYGFFVPGRPVRNQTLAISMAQPAERRPWTSIMS